MPMPPHLTAWTTEEEQILRAHYGKVSWADLMRLLPGRSKPALIGRAGLLGLRRVKEPPWTPEEEGLLRELFHHRTHEQLARKLKRSVISVKMKAKRMGLRRRKRRALTPSQIGRAMRTCSKRVKAWIRQGLLRGRTAPTVTKEIHLVEVDHLISFLEAHPDLWDARRCPDLHVRLGLTTKRGEVALQDRPLWLKEKLAADLQAGREGRRWSPQEDVQLARYVKQGLTYRQIGERMGRSESAVDHRVNRLGRRIWELVKQGA